MEERERELANDRWITLHNTKHHMPLSSDPAWQPTSLIACAMAWPLQFAVALELSLPVTTAHQFVSHTGVFEKPHLKQRLPEQQVPQGSVNDRQAAAHLNAGRCCKPECQDKV